MWTKIYLIALAVLVLPMAFSTFYTWSWLQSIGNPQVTVENFQSWANFSWTFLWISAVILLVLANILLWKTRKAWAMWTTFAYFSVFIILKYFLLDESLSHFKKAHGLWEGGISIGMFFGVILCALAAAIVFFNQFIVLRMNTKMYPPAPLPLPLPDEPEIAEPIAAEVETGREENEKVV